MAFVIEVKVRPHAGRSSLAQDDDGRWLAQLQAAPVDGKANQELIALVAHHFGCPRKAVSIKAGARSRLKRLHIDT